LQLGWPREEDHRSDNCTVFGGIIGASKSRCEVFNSISSICACCVLLYSCNYDVQYVVVEHSEVQ
jgi:hypothetical protein